MVQYKKIIWILLLLSLHQTGFAQEEDCLVAIVKHKISSKYLNETREYWVSFPMHYNENESYPVLYVLDAEWRFDLIRAIAYDLSGNKKMPKHIIVGIPHVEMNKQRGIDLTFSHSTIEYDGDTVDSTWYNATNSGGAMKFFNYLNEEVIKDVDRNYKTNNFNVLIGHSYGGYFGGYILPLSHQFKAFQIYDPSMWYGAGEAEKHVVNKLKKPVEAHIFISYQLTPKYHKDQIDSYIKTLSTYKGITLEAKQYPNETHNALFMQSFIDGMNALYAK